MKNNDWYKVDIDGLPENDGKYFAVLNGGNFKIVSYKKEIGFYHEDDANFKIPSVKYWKELPELPNLENKI